MYFVEDTSSYGVDYDEMYDPTTDDVTSDYR